MAKFGSQNLNSRENVQQHDMTVNHEGGIAFKYDNPKMELFTRVMCCMFNEPKFYGSVGDIEKEILSLIGNISKTDPEWVLRLAKYVRHEGNLRSIPLVLLVEVAENIKKENYLLSPTQKTSQKSLVRPFVKDIVSRADEITETLAFYKSRYSTINKMPLSLKRGLADSFSSFSTYQLLKYDRESMFSLGDAINVLHPHPEDKYRKALYTKLRNWDFDSSVDDLVAQIDAKSKILSKKTIDADVLEAVSKGDITWEVFISHFGSTEESWTAIAPNMPYMATLRNLRNFILKGVSESALKEVASKLSNEKAVLNSKQFPFRYQSALASLSNCEVVVPKYIVKALSDALEISVRNLPKLGGITAVFSDNSGSMHSPLSKKTIVNYIDVASLMSAIAYSFSDEAVVGAFGETFKFVNLNPNDSVLTNMDKIKTTDVGHSTNAYLSIKTLTNANKKVDRIFIFSDMQCYDSRGMWGYHSSLTNDLDSYRTKVNPDVKVYSYDLAGYGTAQFPNRDKNVVTLAGFSEKIFKFMELFESDAESILDVISKY